MRTIYKYPVPSSFAWDDFSIDMPVGAIFRRFAKQDENLFMWLEVETDKSRMAHRHFCIVGTGHSIPLHAEYRGTCEDGHFIWHLYEL